MKADFKQSYFIKTYGCQMNERDSKKIAEILEEKGYKQVDNLENTDLFIINSCSVRQSAEDSVYGWGKKIGKLSKKPEVILCGCLSGSAKGERARILPKVIKNKAPWIDYLVAPSEINSFFSAFPNSVGFSSNFTIPKGLSKQSPFVTISTGCDNFCSYCVVPYSRKAEKSKSKEDIILEIEKLVCNGFSEITLLGQNVNSWNLSDVEKFKIRAGSAKKLPFANLLREICGISQIKKVEFFSSNPFDFTLDLVDALKNPKMSRFLHIAVQSGDDEILKKMNRRHTAKEFINLVKTLYKEIPDIKISTDLIVGFPGESDLQFENTVFLCKKVRFFNAYISKYSPRPGTAAYNFKDSVPLDVKRSRHKRLLEVVKEYKK